VVAETGSGVTVKDAELAPWGTPTLGGMVKSPGFELTAMEAPPEGAPAVNCRVQVEVAGGVTDAGLQVKPFKAAGWLIVTVPPLAEEVKAKPEGSAAIGTESWTGANESVVAPDRVRSTVATTPFPIAVLFLPQRTHVVVPGAELHDTDLFAADAIEPGPTAAAEKSFGG
jgi:hypothetical protein